MNKTWSILPAANLLFNKNKVSIKEIADFWENGTVVICRKPNGKLHFIAGSSGNYSSFGVSVDLKHDQTLARIGTWEVINECNYFKKPDGTLEAIFAIGNMELGRGENIDFKAPMAVFK